jgi:hypothetical protein
MKTIEMNDIKMDDTKMEATVIFDSYLPDALQHALEYAGDHGFVASMPQLLHARANATYDNIIWNTWFTSNSEESVVTTPQGNHVVVTVHGGGIFATPERFRMLYHSNVSRYCKTGFTGLFAGKITEQEIRNMLNGNLPDGTVFPIFSFDEFKGGVANLPRRYAVVTDFETAKNSISGYRPFDNFREDPFMIVRAGGIEPLAAYLNRARDRHNTAVMGSWHPFNNINPDQPQTRVPVLAGNKGGVGSEDDDGHLYGYDAEYGMGGDSGIHNSSMINIARYVAVAPRNVSRGLRYIPFEM